MATTLTTVELNPTGEHRYSVIWLHGLGADGHDFENLAPQLQLDEKANIHFIFPNAPIRPVTVNGGMKMRSWYDISGRIIDQNVDFAGIYQASESVTTLIERERELGIPTEYIMLAGFSQGGVIALHTGLRYPHRLAGIIALSTYLPTCAQLECERAEANNDVPIFMGHGILDSVVAVETAKSAYNALKNMNYDIEWHDYLMEHAVCGEEVADISNFMNALFPARALESE